MNIHTKMWARNSNIYWDNPLKKMNMLISKIDRDSSLDFKGFNEN